MLAHRTNFYMKLKQLNTEIQTFKQCSRAIVPNMCSKKAAGNGVEDILDSSASASDVTSLVGTPTETIA